jgi:hypothetical protein
MTLTVAPLRLRVLACLVTLLVGCALLAAGAGLAAGAYQLARRLKRLGHRPGGTPHALEDVASTRRFANAVSLPASAPHEGRLQLDAWTRTMRAVTLTLGLAREDRPSVGYRVVGLRLVDALAGGPLTVRQKLIRIGARTAWSRVLTRLLPGPRPRSPALERDLKERLERARLEHEDDAAARQQALAKLFSDHRVAVRPVVLVTLARSVLQAALALPIPGDPLRRSILDRLAGTVVVVQRGPC